MSYIINNSRGELLVVVPDGTINTTATSVSLIGQGVTNFGTAQNENFVYMLENFADAAPPSNAITGQLWYDTTNDLISAYSTANTWVALASQAYVQAQKISPAFSGIPTAPTAANATNTTQLATTAFVQNNLANQATFDAATYAPLISPALSGIPTAPTANAGTATTQLATTAFVTSSPEFTGVPIAPTAANLTNTTQLATTAFVQNNKYSPVFTGVPTAPTATSTDNSTQLATTAFVQAQKASPAFTGVPTAPTANVGTSNTQIATTAFVNSITGTLGTMSQQNANNVAITGGSIVGITDLAVADGGTGASTAANARVNLGLGSMATQNANNVVITGGTIAGISPIAVADGGTGAVVASAARTNLGLGTMATQNANSVAIVGGSIQGITDLSIADGGTGASNAADARLNLGLGTMATQQASSVTISGGTIQANVGGNINASSLLYNSSNVATVAYVDAGLSGKLSTTGGYISGAIWRSDGANVANNSVLPNMYQVDNYSRPYFNRLTNGPQTVSFTRVYTGQFTWGNGVTSGVFQWDLNSYFSVYSPDQFFIGFTGFSPNWYLVDDPGRLSTWNISKSMIWHFGVPGSTYSACRLQATITSDGYPMPGEMRVEVYITTPTSAISNTTLQTSTSNITLYYSSRPLA